MTATGRPRLHAHWQLAEPVSATEYVWAKQRLAAALRSDPAICDAPRIMRLPGTFNFKEREPRPFELVEHDARRVYVAAEVVGDLPDLPEPGKPEVAV